MQKLVKMIMITFVFRWHLDTNGYASSKQGRLHRFIMNAKKGEIVDHINNNKLDNRKSNLRIVTYSQNGQNKIKRQNTSSKFIGVSKASKHWSCSININNIKKSINFENEEHAAYWYDQLALKYYGHHAKINGINKPIDFIEPKEKNRDLPIGVYLVGKRYRSMLSGKYLGSYETVEEAQNKYIEAKEKLNSNIKNICLNIERNVNEIAIIKTNKNEEFMVSDEDYFDLKQYTWCTDTDGYSISRINKKLTPMHVYLMKSAKDEIVDHINHNIYDNRRTNLRISTRSKNSHNKTKQSNTSSRYIGVCYYKSRNKYIANIQHNKKSYFLGYYETEMEAADVYNKKAIELYGDFANLNIITNP